ncbi:MAG TPA: hypothetical protein VF824_10425 [Thermoanaerobaculia bacterium]|jgi:hypothetical protein
MKTTLLSFLLCFLAASAFAGDGAVSLSPAVITLRGEAGQSTTQTLVLRNGTSRTLTFDVVAQDVVVRDGQRAFAQAGSIAASIAATAVFSQRRVVVASGDSAAVTVTLTIPPNAANRAVVALFRGTDKFMNGRMPSTASLGSLLTFALSDAVTMAADPMRVAPQSSTSNLAVAQTCVNSGSEPLVARGMLAVIDAHGALAGKAALAPRRLLPGERAELATEYAGELAPGHYRLLVTYDYEGHALTQSSEIDVQ